MGLYQTRGINDAVATSEQFAKEITAAICKFFAGDWGDTCASDTRLNDNALANGERIVALYNTSKGRVFIITEHGHEITTILFGHEY